MIRDQATLWDGWFCLQRDRRDQLNVVALLELVLLTFRFFLPDVAANH